MGNLWIEHLDAPSPHDDASSPPPPPCRHALLSLSPSLASPPPGPLQTAYPPPRFVCSRCRADLTLLSDVVWEGVMGQGSEPAYLSRRTVNVDEVPPVRAGVSLSSGTYDLVDVECRGCRVQLGWKYLRRSGVEGERFKIGCTMLASARMRRVSGFDDGGDDGGGLDDDEGDAARGARGGAATVPSSRRRVVGIGRFL